LQGQQVKISFNGVPFTGEKSTTFNQLMRVEPMQVEIQNYKSVVYLQNASGYWTDSIVQWMGGEVKAWLGKQNPRVKKYSNQCQFTLAGLAILKKMY
jgi:hypothetical protein